MSASSNKKALLIGINYKNTSSELRGCINDVKDIKDMLINKFNFDPKSMKILIEEKGFEKPTKKNIVDQLRLFVENAKQDDTLFFHYSGHGSYINDTNGDEEDGRDECLVPLDYNQSGLIPDDELKLIISKLPEGCKMTAILDCCHSGTGFDLRYNTRLHLRTGFRWNGRVRKFVRSFDLRNSVNQRQTITPANIVMFSGCRDNQTSADAYEDGNFVGAMSWGFKKIVSTSNIQSITYTEFLRKLRALLKQRGYTQIPQLSSGRMINTKTKFQI